MDLLSVGEVRPSPRGTRRLLPRRRLLVLVTYSINRRFTWSALKGSLFAGISGRRRRATWVGYVRAPVRRARSVRHCGSWRSRTSCPRRSPQRQRAVPQLAACTYRVRRVASLPIAERGRGVVRLRAPQVSASRPVPGRHRIRSVQLAWVGGVAALLLLAAAVAIWSLAGVPRDGRPVALSRHGLMSLPVAARGPVSAALGRDEPRYRVLGLRARNPAQRLRVAFSAAGVTVASGKTRVHLALLAYGRESALERVRSVSPEVLANRVAYAHAGVREWYANGPLGLEQGFDVAG